MVLDTSVVTQLRNFETQTMPTAEEIIQSNGAILYKRKKYFLTDFRECIKFLGLVVIVIIYLRDISMLRLVLRTYSQVSLTNPFPQEDTMSLSDENKRALAKFHLVGVLFSNGFCFIIHLLFGVVDSRFVSGSGFLNGGLTIQFIGEKQPSSRLELLLLDILVCFLQLIYHSLMCVIDDSEVLAKVELLEENDDESNKKLLENDGYNGNVDLITVNLLSNIKKVLNYPETLHYPNFMQTDPELSSVQPPGAYVS